MIKVITNYLQKLFFQLFGARKRLKLGVYGPPNSGKSTLSNRICKDWTGEGLSTVSKIPHETRNVNIKESVIIKHKGKELTFNIADTPGIATKIDYE